MRKETILAVRLSPELKKEFYSFCAKKIKRPVPDVLREIIKAAADGRLKIVPTAEQLSLFQTGEKQ